MRDIKRYSLRLMILSTTIAIMILFNYHEIYALPETIRVGFSKNTPPFQFIDNQGNPAGMHIDILNSIVEERGLILDFIPFNNSVDAKNAFISGEVDLILGIEKPLISDYNPNMSINLSSVSLSLFVPKDISIRLKNSNDFKSHRVAFEYDTVAAQILSSIAVKYFILTANQVDLIDHQLKGKSDLFIGAKESILFQLNQMGLEKEYEIMNKHLGYLSYVMQISNKEKELFHILGHEMARLQASRGYERIYNKWIIAEENETIKRIIKNIVYIGIAIALFAAVFIYLNIKVRTFLKRKIEEQNQEIKKTNIELEYRIQQIQDANELRNNIIKYSPRSMILFDYEYNITFINKSACLLAGVDNSIVGTSVMESSVYGYILKDIIEEIFQSDYTPDNRTIDIEGDNGLNKNYRYSIQQIRESKRVIGVLLTVEDITREENEKRELFEREKNLMLNRVVAGIAHEIRNPLTSIRTFVTLARPNINNIRLREFFEKYIPEEINRINRLVESLINYAKPSNSKKSVVEVSTLIYECVFFIKNAVQNKGIIIKEDISDNIKIYADRDQIKQVFINILMNSIESMEEKMKSFDSAFGELHIEVFLQNYNKDVIIRIRDEGMGIKEEILEYCMDPFFTTKRNGTGIGLALSKQYIEENNGKIFIESKADEYTQIHLEFRRYRDEACDNHY